MSILNPKTPIFNAVVFYIMTICIIIITKPTFMFDEKTKKFKSFGCGKRQTLLAFPVVSISLGVILYMCFLGVDIVSNVLEKKT